MALEALAERTQLLGKVADRLQRRGNLESAATMRERSRGAAERAELVRGILTLEEDPLAVVREGA